MEGFFPGRPSPLGGYSSGRHRWERCGGCYQGGGRGCDRDTLDHYGMALPGQVRFKPCCPHTTVPFDVLLAPRDFSGQILGNMYTTFWEDSAAVASELASETRLASVVGDINAHHESIASPLNPPPVWLKDMLVNQWSHFHMLMWYKDGRLREYEASSPEPEPEPEP